MFKMKSEQESVEGVRRILPYVKLYTLFSAAAVPTCLGIALYLSPADGFENTPEFEQKSHSLRERYVRPCENERYRSSFGYTAQEQCVTGRAHSSATQSYYGVQYYGFLGLAVMFIFQSAAAQILARRGKEILHKHPHL